MAAETLRPNAAGSETSIPWQAPVSTYHWDKVDEETADEGGTSIGTTSTNYSRDLYNLPSHSVGSGVINSITIYFRIKGASTQLAYGMASQKSGTTVTDGTAQTQADSWATKSQTYTKNPATNAAYTWTEIDALQIGVSLKQATSGYYAYCTQVYVEVNYTLAVARSRGFIIG